MNISVDGPYIYFEIPIFGGIPITQTTISLLVVSILLCTAFILLGRNLKKRPSGRQVLVEKGVVMMREMVIGAMGEHNARFVPLIGTIFLSSICGSLIGMTGFLRSTTADLSVPLVWAVMVSVIIWAQNIKHNGFVNWLKGFTEPIVIMTPMNLISEIAQPMAMAFRHFGNVAGGSVISAVLYTALGLASSVILKLIASSGVAVSIVLILVSVGLFILMKRKKKAKLSKKILLAIPTFLSAILGVAGLLQVLLQSMGDQTVIPALMWGVPAILSLYFDLFSGFIQALVFSMLSMVYIAGACPPPAAEPEA